MVGRENRSLESDEALASTVSTQLEPLVDRVRATRRRLRLIAGLSSVAQLLPIALIISLVFAALVRFEGATWGVACGMWAVCGLSVLAVAARSYQRGPTMLSAAVRLDRASQASGRLASAFEFSRAETELRPKDEPYVALLLADLPAHMAVSAAQAAPLTWSSQLFRSAILAALIPVVLLLSLPSSKSLVAPPLVPTAKQATFAVSADDAELLQEAAARLRKQAASNQAKQLAEKFNDIVLSVVAGKTDQLQAFQMAASLQAEMSRDAADAERLREELARRGEELKKQGASRAVGEPMSEGRLVDAAEALRRLAERVRSADEGLSQRELEELRSSLESLRKENERKAAEANQGAASDKRAGLQKRHDELEKKKQQGNASKKELSELADTKRQLKRLDRQKKATSQAQKTLSELDKQLAQAARALSEEQKKSGQFFDQAAESVEEADKRTLTDDEKRELLKQIKQLKDRLSKQRKEGKQAQSLRDFQNRARGKKRAGQGKSKPGDPGKPGQSKFQLGPGGSAVPIPQAGKGKAQGKESGDAAPASGPEAGSGHDPKFQGHSTELPQAGTYDAAAVAQDSGEGASASQTIESASEEGFTRASYQKLFREYQTVAEEIIEHESVPPGRKAQVQRYFELIRPRKGDQGGD